MTLQLTVAGTGRELRVEPTRLIVAGYTARDQDAVARHIAELAAIGVAPPDTVPSFFHLDPALLTTDMVVEVPGANTSGEVEPVVIRAGGRNYLAVGSDHTDRDRERDDVAASKAVCPKPIGPVVAELPDDLDSFDWDHVTATSTADGATYQHASLAELLRPAAVLARLHAALGDHVAGRDLVLFGGTTPLLGGTFVPATRWTISLGLPGGTRLDHTYDTLIKRSPEEKR
jgi:hypothetical protein